MTTSAVVFLIFNRPIHTRRVFEAIREARPSRLLVVADGPRQDHQTDAELCTTTRGVIREVDWSCDVLTNYSETNLGCGRCVSTGLTWAFQQVEEAIILEDDCLPNSSFFPFCDKLLTHYRHDTRLMAVCGDNYQKGKQRGTGSYYFSKHPGIWGWATWRRAWSHYDWSMALWPEFRDNGWLRLVCPEPREHQFWYTLFEKMHSGYIDTWDYQWVFAVFAQGGLVARSNRNLISNIGFGSEATHTTAPSPLSNIPVEELGECIHPRFILADTEADFFEFEWTQFNKRSAKEMIASKLSSVPEMARRFGYLLGRIVQGKSRTERPT